jgi:hypothetical protein
MQQEDKMLKETGKYGCLATIMCVFMLSKAVCSAGDKLTVFIPDYTLMIQPATNRSILKMETYGLMNIPGKPALPSRIFAVAVPPGAIIEDVTIRSGRIEKIHGFHSVDPVDMVLPLTELSPGDLAVYEKEYQLNYQNVYEKDAFWPDSIGWMVRNAGFRKYQLVDVQINPVRYNPVTGELILHHDLQIDVTYFMPERLNPLNDNSPRMESLARNLILNYDQAQAWYPENPKRNESGYDLVIITTELLLDAVSGLVQFESEIKGRSVYVATLAEILSTVSGVDLEQKIRYFLLERYPTEAWGIEDVLLVGHHTHVPMRMVNQSVGYGSPRTDFYYAELTAPDDVNWDSNQNGRYWDNSDTADFYSEVNVGRIPWSDPAIVAAICQKSIDFELNQDPAFKENALILGSFFWKDTDNAVLMEQIMNRPQMANWTSVRMYEKNSTVHSTYDCDYPLERSNVVDIWPSGKFAFTNMAGHGSYGGIYQMGFGSASFWTSSLCGRLSNEYPSIVFSVACSNSDTDYINLGQRMLENGAVGFVGATKVAFGSQNWSHPGSGSSQSLDYYFSDALTSKEHTQGSAHQYGLMQNYQQNGWYYPKYEIAEWNLWGIPTLGLDLPVSPNAKITIDRNVYSVNDQMTVTVRDSNLVPGEESIVQITTSSGDAETLLLETTDVSGIFTGTIQLAESHAIAGNKRLDVQHGDTVTVRYVDSDNGAGGTNIEKTAVSSVDGIAPEIFNIQTGRVTSDSIEIRWEISKPATCSIRYGDIELDRTEEIRIPNTTHSIILSELSPCTYYYFVITATDSAGNSSVEDNLGTYHRINTFDREIFYYEPLNVDPGWITEGLWEFGKPEGMGGANGYPDPTSGFSGQNVYGYNLSGDYENDQPAYGISSGRIDCGNATDVTVHFKRWLGVERNMNDKASFEVSSDGVNFTKIWENPDIETTDMDWESVSYDISHVADGESSVYLRWVMGSTNGSKTFCGWNIDDITLTRSISCMEPTPLPRATATPVPPGLPSTGIHLSMDDYTMKPGSEFSLVMTLRNGLAQPVTVDVYVALEVYGNFWFWPTWISLDEGVSFLPAVTLPSASEYSETILQFTWPDVSGPAHGLFFYGLLLDSMTRELVGSPCGICWEFL